MNVTVISAFRNAAHTLERYCEQMDGLQAMLHKRGDSLTLLLGYGDSTDGTEAALFDECSNRFCAHLVDVSHGGPVFASIEDPVRFKHLAYVGNRLLAHVPSDAGVVGIVESDLIWEPSVLVQLIEDLEHLPPDYGAVAPMVMDGPASFYDSFAFRKNGVRFTKTPPYHADIEAEVEQNPQLSHVISLIPLDSAGSVLFMDAYLARKARFSDGEAIVGFCRDIYRLGGSIWLDTQASVAHP